MSTSGKGCLIKAADQIAGSDLGRLPI
jgi:hypothetical protein